MSRAEKARPPLTAEALGAHPLAAFERWLAEAEERGAMNYANAMTLSTLAPDGIPDGRVVLLKGVDQRGFLFYTNYRSEKGRALAAHPYAGLTFYWDALGRQVRVRGGVERLPASESDSYFRTRPSGSRVGAWASEQSEPLEGREALEARYRELEARYGEEVPRPPHWGGYVLRPMQIEFWQDGRFRLHDRFRFTREEEGGWSVIRLSP